MATPPVSVAPACPSSGGFSVCSWNVLAQSYTHSHEVPAEAKRWPHRGHAVLTRIQQQRPDILALQEVDHYRDHYRDRLNELGYDVHYAPRSGVPDKAERAEASEDHHREAQPIAHASPADWNRRSASKRSKCDGILIAWHRSRFRLAGPPHEAAHIVDFDDLAFAEEEVTHLDAAVAKASLNNNPDAASSGSQAASHLAASSRIQQHRVKFLRHNVGMFVFLVALADSAHAAAGTILLVANTHLYWNPMHEDAKLKQFQYLMARIEMECKRRAGTATTAELAVDQLAQQISSASLEDGGVSTLRLSSIGSYPFILAGDLNSSPLSMLYNYISQGVYERKALPDSPSSTALSASSSSSPDVSAAVDLPTKGPGGGHSSAPRFICDSDLTKVAKWLRSIGVDCAHYTDKEKKERGHTGMFARAVNERRIIITKSLRLLERRNCPPWFLLRSSNLEVAFAALILHFGLSFDEKLFYSRCIFCNSEFDAYPAAYFTGGRDHAGVLHQPHEPFIDIPRGFINLGYKDELGNVLTFTRCRNEDRYTKCGKLFWWGHRSGAAVELFQARMDQAINLHHQEDKDEPTTPHPDESEEAGEGEEKGKASSSHQITAAHARSIPPTRQAELRLARSIAAFDLDRADARVAHSLSLTSAYAQAGGSEPPFTNLTSTFQDTLDYIFFHSPASATQLRLQSVRCVTDDAHLDLAALEKTAGGDLNKPPPAKAKREKKVAPVEDGPPSGSPMAQKAIGDSEPSIPLSLALPNLSWPSDHLLLQTTFTLD